MAEVMANAGFDGLVLDMQHGMAIGPDRAALWLQAVSTTNTVPMIRLPWNEPVQIQYALDAGALGVIVPLVRNLEEAAKAGRASRYPPLGFRSTGGSVRARVWAGQDYIERANDEIVCLVMVEDQSTILELGDMARAPGIDGFYVGPTDLAMSMGLPPGADNKDPKHVAAVQAVLDAANAAGLVAGIHTTGPDETVRRFEQGFKFCPIGFDTAFVANGARLALERYRSSRSDNQ